MNHTKQYSQSLALHNHTQLNNGYQQLQSLPHSYRRRLPRQFKTTLISVAVALVLGHSPQARTATITVNTTNPTINTDTQCSLIEAINNANDDAATHADCPAGSGADTIILSGNTYSLLVADNLLFHNYGENSYNGLPQITGVITIQGNGAIIERAAAATEDFRLFAILTSGDLTLEETTVSEGITNNSGTSRSYKSHGGGLFNRGSLTLTNSTVSGNTADYGGGLFNSGTVILTNSTISDNIGLDWTGTGGLSNRGTATLTNSTVSGNLGSGIYNSGTVTLTKSTVSDNRVYYGGGGINNFSQATLISSPVSGNSSSRGGGSSIAEPSPLQIARSATMVPTGEGGSSIAPDKLPS